MAAHVWILLEVTAVIALLDGLEQLARVNCFIYAFRNVCCCPKTMKRLNAGDPNQSCWNL